MPTISNDCACGTCEGPKCTCGCQAANAERRPGCPCGDVCRCGATCGCKRT